MHLQTLTSAARLLVLCLFIIPQTGRAAGGDTLDASAANEYCERHRAEWNRIWEEYDVPCDVAEAVIFPELIRYSIFQDRMEAGAVKSLYVAKGSAGCDFSIGRFQMKPSFAEYLEKRWMRSGLARPYNLFFDTKDNETARKIRANRLEKEEWQCVYLAVFLKMLYLDYGSVDKNGEHTQKGIDALLRKEQVRLAATAYNSGCRWVNPGYGSLDELRKKSREKHFHTAVLATEKTPRYAYGDIAVDHWLSLKSATKSR